MTSRERGVEVHGERKTRRESADEQDRRTQRSPHTFRQARRRPVERRRHRARRHRDRGRARARRGQARPGPARRHGPGAAGRPGADPVPPGPDQGRDPQGGLLRDRQQGLRLEPAGRRHRRPGRARGRPRARRRRRHGVDVAGALPAAQGALRLPHGRRQDGRRDDPRRAHQPVHGQDDGPGGLRGRRGARDDAGRPRQVRAAQPPARRAGDRRGPARGGDRARDGVLQEGRHHRRDRRGPALRGDARDAGQAQADLRGRHPHRGQLAGRQRRRRRARAGRRGVGEGQRPRVAGDDRRAGRRGRRLRLPRAHAREGDRARAREGGAQASTTSTCSRSTRRSPRWR